MFIINGTGINIYNEDRSIVVLKRLSRKKWFYNKDAECPYKLFI